MIRKKQLRLDEQICNSVLANKIEAVDLVVCITTMPNVYSYAFTSDGEGPWWGIRCSKSFYQTMVRDLDDATRCFVYMTNVRGETVALAVEGPHNEDPEQDNVFAPNWVFERLNIEAGDEVIIDAISEALPGGETVTIRPLTGSTVEGPMFLEGLTEALNQLGVVQEGLLYAVVDPSTDVVHQFMIESLTPLSVCLADGELRVNLERAMDRPPTPTPPAVPEREPVDFDSLLPGPCCLEPKTQKFVPFSGQGRRLDGK